MDLPSETKFQIAILTDTLAGMSGLDDTSSIEWLLCRQAGEFLFEFYKGHALLSSVNLQSARFELPYLLSVFVAGSADDLELLQGKWDSALPSLGVTFQRISERTPMAILHAALDCLAENLTLHRRQSGRTSLELATYRKEFDRLQRGFMRLEEYVSRRSYVGATEIFEYMPETEATAKRGHKKQIDGAAGLGASDSTGVPLIQSLPVDSLGLSSISIYVSAKPESGGELLRVRLRAIEIDHIFGEWLLGAAEMHEGWVELALNRAIDEPALSLEVLIEWPSAKGGWSLALGAPLPYKDLCAHTEAREALGAPLAMRLFSSLPGVHVTTTSNAIKPIDALQALTEYVPYEAYVTVVQVVPPLRDSKPTLVFYDREIGCLTVHPRAGGLAIARMDVVIPKNAWAVSAQIHLAHERASATGFALMVCAAADESRELVRLSQLDSPSLSFSGWKVLSPLETRSITVVLAAMANRELSIYLVTRQDPDLSPDFAWARFSKIEFNVLPEALIGKVEENRVAPSTLGLIHAGAE